MRLRLLSLTLITTAMACTLETVASEPTPDPTLVPEPTTVPSPVVSPTPVPPTEPPPTSTPITAEALPDPSGYRWSEIAGGFIKPLALTHAGDDRLFVVEQRGVIWVIRNGQVLPEPFLDIRDRVVDISFEQGLLGLAFHPQHPRNGLFYVNYTNSGGDTVVSRFSATLEASHADPDSELVLLTIDQPFSNHNGGALAFGPDGFLYIATGDGGSANDPFGNGQNLGTLLGKLLRIDIDAGDPYAIPPDNPFSGGGSAPEIWVYGLRNPWRFSFDRLNGDLYIGDVGQNSWEEISFLPAEQARGNNLGWDLREGMHPFASQQTEGLIDPVAEYANNGQTCSVTGGISIRSAELPDWAGVYIYGDYCSGQVWGLVRDSGGSWISTVLFSTGLAISAFGEGADGSAYLVHHGGAIFQLEARP
jgi:glucose/arabinose dehydrogenase